MLYYEREQLHGGERQGKNATWVCSAIRKLQKGECGGMCVRWGICDVDVGISDVGYVRCGVYGMRVYVRWGYVCDEGMGCAGM